MPEVSQTDRVNIIVKLIEDNNAEEERKSSIAEFELRAKSMGITGEKFITQKVAIWEGMRAAQQSGDDIGVSILFSLFLGGYCGIAADRNERLIVVRCLGSLGCCHQRQPVNSLPEESRFSIS